jgi:radical SAM superfamily enzyme YgiQ (UPF0313 family)
MRYKLFLINPKYDYNHYGIQAEFGRYLGKDYFNYGLALPLIASLTPPDYDIEIFDEEVHKIPADRLPDIVGITSIFTTKNRAFKIADGFRAKGISVIMGGSYPTFEHEAALEHCDSVVIGEAEGVWERCLRDWEKGGLKKTYKRDTVYEFKNSPVPRWDLLKIEKINTIAVQTSRGCPYKCDFCLVSKMFGTKQRYRDIDDIVREIESLPIKRIFIIDDNLTFNKKHAKELMRRLIPLKISWACQSSIDVSYDDELLDLMAEAGCISILIGFETVNPDSLKEANKPHNNIELYGEAIKKIHKRGINVTASFAIGFDSDTVSAFDNIIEFTDRNNVCYAMLNILTAAPGTDIYDRLKKEDRLLDISSEFFNGIYPNFKYKNITPFEMLHKYSESIEQLFSPESVFKKGSELFKNGSFKRGSSEKLGLIGKLSAIMKVLEFYYFTKDEFKKKLFFKFFGYGRKNIASWDNIVLFLLAMAGYREFTLKYKKDMKIFESLLREKNYL